MSNPLLFPQFHLFSPPIFFGASSHYWNSINLSTKYHKISHPDTVSTHKFHTQIDECGRVVTVGVLGQLGVVLGGLAVPLQEVEEAEVGGGRGGHLRLLLLEGLEGVGGVGKVLIWGRGGGFRLVRSLASLLTY